MVVGHPPYELREIQRPVLEETRVEDVTVILYSGGSTGNILATQLDSLRQQTVHPRYIWIHVDGTVGHDERTLASMLAFRTPHPVGRNHRLMLARHAETTYVAILDEDTIPGRRWLERSIQALASADPSGEMPFGVAILASSGILVDSDGRTRSVGPEFPRDEAIEVDYGRQAWLFKTDLAASLDTVFVAGSSPGSFGLRLAAGAHAVGVPTVVLDYGVDRDLWLSQFPSQLYDDPAELAAVFGAYLEAGWAPMSHQDQAIQAPMPSPSGTWGAPQPPPLSVPISNEPQPNAFADMGSRPGDVVRGSGSGVTIIERILADQAVRLLETHEARELHGSEATPAPLHAATEQLIAPSSPPLYQATEQLVPNSPLPANVATERVVGTSRPPASAATETIIGP
jgi:hypothetical protein